MATATSPSGQSVSVPRIAGLTGLGIALCVGTTACGGTSATTKPAPVNKQVDNDPNPNKHVSKTPDVDNPDDDKVSFEGTKGHLEKHQIDAGMAPHLGELTRCYTNKIGHQRYIGGELEFSFVIAVDGSVDKVYFKRSTLGAWHMEQCMLEVSRKMRFTKPRGGKPADFTVPLTLNGTSPTTWWDEERGTKEVGNKPAKLKDCAKNTTNPKDVWVTVYVGTRGKVLSAGFASATGPIPEDWAKCAAAAVGKWQLTDPRGHIAKAGFRYNAE